MPNNKLLVETTAKVLDTLHSAFRGSPSYSRSDDQRQVTIDMRKIKAKTQTGVVVAALNSDANHPVNLKNHELNAYCLLIAIC